VTPKRSLAVIFQTVFLDLLGFGIVLPLLPLYAERFGASPLKVTLLSASYSLMQFLFVPIWGRVSDRIGRRPVLLVSIAGACAAYILMGFAVSLPMLFVARILSGIAGANLSAAQAAITDTTTPEDRARGMGMIGAAFGLGFILGPFLGGTLSSVSPEWLPGPLRAHRDGLPFFAAALFALTNFLLATRWLQETLPATARRKVPAALHSLLSPRRLVHAWTDDRLGGLYGLVFFSTFAFAQMETTFVLWGEHTLDMSSRQAGWLFAYIGVVMVAMQGGLVGRLSRRFGERRLVIVGTFATALGLLIAPACRSYPPLLGALALVATGSGMAGPSIQSLISKRAAEDERGGVLGLNQSFSSLARVLGPPLAGYLFGSLGPSLPWVSGGILMTAVGLASVRVLRLDAIAEARRNP
jgi:DHA1 family tetracycline resistance protein-like MFS transporter